jgi:DNA-binding LacI/PurR family transcriptional regulator
VAERDETGDKGAASRPSRRPRLEDVAARVGLSPASVSLVLRNVAGPSAETRRRVLEAAEQLGYRPHMTASLLARRRTHLLGVMLDIRNAFHTELVEHMHGAAERLGYDLVLSTVTSTRNEQRAVESLTDFRCEALILVGPDSTSRLLTALGRQQPVVVVGRRTRAAEVDIVRSADDDGVGQAVGHLASLGHDDIAYVDGGRGTIASDRRRGYRTAMRRHGLVDHLRIIPGDHTEAAGIAAAQTLLDDNDPPTAVVTFNDRCALGLFDALNRAGADIPGDLSIVGYDNTQASQLAHVNLTTVSQDAQQQAEYAVTAAAERLEGQAGLTREVVLTPHLIVRGTSAAARPKARTLGA